MSTTRPISNDEKKLIAHLLKLANAENLIHTIPDFVSPYNSNQPESINLSGTDAENYGGDIVSVEYKDSDNIRVIISLTHDHDGNLLDLDFWKEDFVNLIQYPTPEQVRLL